MSSPAASSSRPSLSGSAAMRVLVGQLRLLRPPSSAYLHDDTRLGADVHVHPQTESSRQFGQRVHGRVVIGQLQAGHHRLLPAQLGGQRCLAELVLAAVPQHGLGTSQGVRSYSSRKDGSSSISSRSCRTLPGRMWFKRRRAPPQPGWTLRPGSAMPRPSEPGSAQAATVVSPIFPRTRCTPPHGQSHRA